jgi:endonuclease YncB( thermonuclease family)
MYASDIDVGRFQRSGRIWRKHYYLYVNLMNVQNRFYRKYGKDLKLYDLENEARASRRGLWADANPMPPWEWRKKKSN